MSNPSQSYRQDELFPDLADATSEREIFQWEIKVGDITYTVEGATRREALTELGRAMGSVGQPETSYRLALQRKPEIISQISVKFLAQK
ncbi:hypothetical protein KKB10_01065 [Patescibacteria group bacterium]|nr:hypothetical protein [Patescibacteria group bacterium]MBU1075308.1 hypothetical protein [Patescibacteria group bacterium]MBU1951747.1 hypothetical protein [Patescibacteria group bacterium]